MKVTAVTPFVVDPGYGKNWLFLSEPRASPLLMGFSRPSVDF